LYLLRQLDIRQPERVDAPYNAIERVPLSGFSKVTIGLKLIADQNIHVGLRTTQNDRWYHFEAAIRLDFGEDLMAIHFWKVQIQQDEVRPWNVEMGALLPQESHGLHAVASHVQTNGPVDVAEGFAHQSDVPVIVFDQENLNRSVLFPDGIHSFLSLPAITKLRAKTARFDSASMLVAMPEGLCRSAALLLR
jgi:hypothetical protein